MSIEIEVVCVECGSALEAEISVKGIYPRIEVGPCGKCIEKAKVVGHDEGYTEGKDAGYEAGLADGERK